MLKWMSQRKRKVTNYCKRNGSDREVEGKAKKMVAKVRGREINCLTLSERPDFGGAQSGYCILSKYWAVEAIDYACRAVCSSSPPNNSLYPAFHRRSPKPTKCMCDGGELLLTVGDRAGAQWLWPTRELSLSTNGHYYFEEVAELALPGHTCLQRH